MMTHLPMFLSKIKPSVGDSSVDIRARTEDDADVSAGGDEGLSKTKGAFVSKDSVFSGSSVLCVVCSVFCILYSWPALYSCALLRSLFPSSLSLMDLLHFFTHRRKSKG